MDQKNRSEKLIMVLDDEKDIVLSLQLYLESSGYRVKTYTNPLTALSEFKPHHYALIILDVKMPYLNGFQLYQKLRKIDGTCKVCFITAFESYYQSLKESFPRLDVTCFMQKPVSKERLLEQVAREIDPS